MKKASELLTHAVMLDLFTEVCVQYMTKLRELMKVLSQEQKCLYNSTTTGLYIELCQRTMDVSSYTFTALEIIKYIV